MRIKNGAGVILLSALILSACGPRGVSNNQINSNQATSPTPELTESQVSASISELIGQGKTVKCNWETKAEDDIPATKGTIYVSGNKFHQDITTEATDKMPASQVRVVSDGETIYIWGEGDEQNGMKMNLQQAQELAENSTGTNQQQSDQVDLNKKFYYRCSNWSADNSKFVPATNVQFTDMGEMLESVQQIKNKMPSINIPNISIPVRPDSE